MAQDPATATLMGVNRERVIVITFLVGGVLAGAAALFYLMTIPQGAVFNGGFLLGIKAFAAAVLGGIGNLRGALLGSVAHKLLRQMMGRLRQARAERRATAGTVSASALPLAA